MKKIFSLAALLLVALTTMTSLTSCDELIASDLEGTWEGNMYMSSTYNGRTYDATYTEIEFLRSPFKYKSGKGYWVDHYNNSSVWGNDYVANHITWTVDDGTIKVHFEEENTNIYIDDYRLSDNHFSGYLEDNGNRVRFSLVHTSSPNWEDDYEYDYYYDNYYYSKSANTFDSRSGNAASVEHPKRFLRTK